MACRILVLQPGIEPRSSALKYAGLTSGLLGDVLCLLLSAELVLRLYLKGPQIELRGNMSSYNPM